MEVQIGSTDSVAEMVNYLEKCGILRKAEHGSGFIPVLYVQIR